MTKVLTGKDGTLRICDSKDVIWASDCDVRVWDDSLSQMTDKTSEATGDDASTTGNVLEAAGDLICVGLASKFCRVWIQTAVAAVGTGAMVPKYFNGTSIVDLPAGTWVDGSESGGDCMAQEGYFYFQAPRDWAIGGGGMTGLSSSKHYIFFGSTDVPSTPPDLDVCAPVDGQYQVVRFSQMDFTGPAGRKRTEEQLKMDRGKMSSVACYIEGDDMPIYEPVVLEFSCLIDDAHNREYILEALKCGTPGSSAWPAAGESSKGDTKNDGTNANPAFADTDKKTVNVHIVWAGDSPAGEAYYEVFFPPDEQRIEEGDDGVVLSCKGAVYGVIERAYALANRY